MAKGIYFGNQEVADLPGIAEVWAPSPTTGDLVKVYPSRPVVKITSTTDTGAQNQLRAALTAYGLDYRTVERLPFDLDTSESTNLSSMFNGCVQLVEAPRMDTRNVTKTVRMFSTCNSLIEAPVMDTSKVTDMSDMFVNCHSLVYVPDMDIRSATRLNYMFANCRVLTDGNVRLFNKRYSVTTSNMISGTGLTTLPFYEGPMPPR